MKMRRFKRMSRGGLRWQPSEDGAAFAIAQDGQIYTVRHDVRKRKWILTDSDDVFLGSAIRKKDAERIAEKKESWKRETGPLGPHEIQAMIATETARRERRARR